MRDYLADYPTYRLLWNCSWPIGLGENPEAQLPPSRYVYRHRSRMSVNGFCNIIWIQARENLEPVNLIEKTPCHINLSVNGVYPTVS